MRYNAVRHDSFLLYTFTYDELGNPVTTQVGTQALSTNIYSATGDKQLQGTTYGNGGQVTYTYDEFKRLTGTRYDAATVPQITYHYGKNGDLRKVVDKRLGRTTQTALDNADRPVYVETVNNAEPGQPQSVQYAQRVTYDKCGRVAKRTEMVADGTSYTQTYGYDSDDRPTSVTYAENNGVTYGYNGRGLVERRVQQFGTRNNTVAYTFLPGGYDTTESTLVERMTQTGEDWSYTYDDVGNITEAVENGKKNRYTYDKLGQLTRMDDETEG